MTLKVYVDWNNDNDFSDANEDISADVMGINWRLGMRTLYQMVSDEMSLEITVKNTDGKYNPENSSGPLFGLLLPNRRVKVAFDYSGETVMWSGWLEFPQVEWDPAGSQTGKTVATLYGVGPKYLLEESSVALELFQDVTGDVIIQEVLNQAALPVSITGRWLIGLPGYSELGQTTWLGQTSDYAVFETGVTVFEYYGDSQPPSAWDVIKEITAAERGRFFFSRDGKANWWNRHHFIQDVTDDATVNADSGTFKANGLDYTYGKSLANVIRTEAHPRQTGTSETLWELDTTITVAGGETAYLEARLRKSSGQFVGASSLTASPTFSQGSATVNVTPKGGKADIQIVNNSSSTAAILTGLTLTGEPTIQQNDLAVEVIDETSVATYKRHELNIDLGPVANYTDAKAVAEYELQRRKDARGEVNWIEWTRAGDGTASGDDHLVDWTIGTRLALSTAQLGHSQDYFVIGEEHDWMPGNGGGVHKGRVYLEPADPNVLWLIGTSGYSELGQTTYLGY